MNSLVVLALLALAAGCSPGETGTLEGRVSWQGRGVAGALVQAYIRPETDPAVPPAAEGPTGEDGRFRLELPPGRYWVWARATVPEGGRARRLRGAGAANPVEVPAGGTARAEVPLSDPSGFASPRGPSGTGVTGTVAGSPPRETMVYAYPGHRSRPTGPGFTAAAAPDDTGRFRLDLAPGPYTLAARWRRSGEPHGALAPGDRVAEAQVRVATGARTDVGVLELHPLDPGTWQRVWKASPEGHTWIEGTVVDGNDGTPVAGLWVLAFTDPRMAGRPAALSPPTDPAGRFRIYLPGPGVYVLGARSRLGGPAEPGERIGAYRGPDGAGIRVEAGAGLRGVEIPVEEMW